MVVSVGVVFILISGRMSVSRPSVPEKWAGEPPRVVMMDAGWPFLLWLWAAVGYSWADLVVFYLSHSGHLFVCLLFLRLEGEMFLRLVGNGV